MWFHRYGPDQWLSRRRGARVYMRGPTVRLRRERGEVQWLDVEEHGGTTLTSSSKSARTKQHGPSTWPTQTLQEMRQHFARSGGPREWISTCTSATATSTTNQGRTRRQCSARVNRRRTNRISS